MLILSFMLIHSLTRSFTSKVTERLGGLLRLKAFRWDRQTFDIILTIFVSFALMLLSVRSFDVSNFNVRLVQ